MNVSYATLGELCSINRSGINLYQKTTTDGLFPIIGSGKKPRGFHNEWNVESDSIIISRKGSHGQVSRYGTNTFVTDESFYLTNLSAAVDVDYLYHFLKNIVGNKLRRKTRDKTILTVERLSNVFVLFPSIEEQRTIAAYFNKETLQGPEPSEILKIRYIVQQSNRDVVDMFRKQSSIAWSLVRYSSIFVVIGIAAVFLKYQEDETIDHWMEVARHSFMDMTTYLKAIPLSCAAV